MTGEQAVVTTGIQCPAWHQCPALLMLLLMPVPVFAVSSVTGRRRRRRDCRRCRRPLCSASRSCAIALPNRESDLTIIFRDDPFFLPASLPHSLDNVHSIDCQAAGVHVHACAVEASVCVCVTRAGTSQEMFWGVDMSVFCISADQGSSLSNLKEFFAGK